MDRWSEDSSGMVVQDSFVVKLGEQKVMSGEVGFWLCCIGMRVGFWLSFRLFRVRSCSVMRLPLRSAWSAWNHVG